MEAVAGTATPAIAPIVIIDARVADVEVLSMTAADKVGRVVVTGLNAGVRIAVAAATACEAVARCEASLRPAGTLHGSIAPSVELAIGWTAGVAGLLAVGRVSRRLLAGGGGFEALFQIGAVALELLFEIIAVPRDALAVSTRARAGIGATVRDDGATLLDVIGVSTI